MTNKPEIDGPEERNPAGSAIERAEQVEQPGKNEQGSGTRHEEGASVEVRLAGLGQGRPITIDQITQLLLQVDPTLAARGLVKGLGARQATATESANLHVSDGAGGAAFAGDLAGAEGLWAVGAEIDSGEALEFSFARHAAGVDGELDGEAETTARAEASDAKGAVPGTNERAVMESRASSTSGPEKSIWTVSVMPAAARAVVNAGPGGFVGLGAPLSSIDLNAASVSASMATDRVVGDAGSSDSAGGSEQGVSSDGQRRSGAELAGVVAASADGAAAVKATARAETAAPGAPGTVARQELLAAQIDRALAASVERSTAGRTSHQTVLQLSPRVLGRIRIALTVESNKASVRMQVENREARQLLSDSMPSLVAALQERGIEVESVQIRESEAESVDAEQPSRGAESLRKNSGWNPKRSELASAGGTLYGEREADDSGTPDVIVVLRLDALA